MGHFWLNGWGIYDSMGRHFGLNGWGIYDLMGGHSGEYLFRSSHDHRLRSPPKNALLIILQYVMQMMFSYPGAILPKHLGTIALFPTIAAPSICKYGNASEGKGQFFNHCW